jgi:hypothetical protein
MDKTWLIRNVCAGYCSFYKPGKDEELACKGFLVLGDLALRKDEIALNVQEKMIQDETRDRLYGILCVRCPFFEDGCDFAAGRRGETRETAQEDATPCGGFLFLGACLEQGSIDIQAINQVI